MSSQEGKLSHKVKIKSKYLNLDQQRNISISATDLQISQSGDPSKFKLFPIMQITQVTNPKSNILHICLSNGRTYEIQTKQAQKITKNIQETKNYHQSTLMNEVSIQHKPKEINWGMSSTKSTKNLEEKISTKIKQQPIISDPLLGFQCKLTKPVKKYPRVKHGFYDNTIWQRCPKYGTMTLVHEQLKSFTSKLIKFVLKKIISSGSFNGISYPVFSMRAESMLEFYGKSIACAPLLFDNISNPLERVKRFICFIMTFSAIQLTIQKSFNPVIGQTFQATIAGCRYSAQQISHHPPISAFYFQGKDYIIQSSLELDAIIGVNSGRGLFNGDIKIVFGNGQTIVGKIPNGVLSGLVIGDIQFNSLGGSYVYDQTFNVICTYQAERQNYFKGYIGTLNDKYLQRFKKQLTNNNRFKQFTSFQKQNFDKIFSQAQIHWNSKILIDGKQYYNFTNPQNYPYQLQKPSINNLYFYLIVDFVKILLLEKFLEINNHRFRRKEFRKNKEVFVN